MRCMPLAMDETEVIKLMKAAREAILVCQNSIDFRSPAGREVKATLEKINEFLMKNHSPDA